MIQRSGTPTAVWSGLLLFVSFVAVVGLAGEILGSFGDPDDVFLEYYADSANRVRDIAGALAVVVFGLAFLWHVHCVRVAFGMPPGSVAAWTLAVLFAGLAITAAAALATVPLSQELGNLFDERRPRFEGTEVVVLPQFGYVLLLGAGGIIGGLCVGALALEFRTSPAAPRWLVAVSLVCGALMVLGFFNMPFLALPVWALASAAAAYLAGRQSR